MKTEQIKLIRKYLESIKHLAFEIAETKNDEQCDDLLHDLGELLFQIDILITK